MLGQRRATLTQHQTSVLLASRLYYMWYATTGERGLLSGYLLMHGLWERGRAARLQWQSICQKMLAALLSWSCTAARASRRPRVHATLPTSTLWSVHCDYTGMWRGYNIPVNTKHLYNICTMLDQRRRRWSNVVQMLYKFCCVWWEKVFTKWMQKYINPLPANVIRYIDSMLA